MQLNKAQLEAVQATEGYVRLIAGAGSGKTRVLAHRFAYLVSDLGILPENILCVTFTNKSAAEMRNRIHALTMDNDTGYINTFHGFCNTILQEDSHAIGYPKSFIVLDNSDIDAMLQLVYDQRNLTLRHMSFSAARDMIEMMKLKHMPDYYHWLIDESLQSLYEHYMNCVMPEEIIFFGYLYHQKKCFGLDYNDLIILTLYIFEQNPDIAQKWQERLEYIMIDEFQDIDGLQYKLMDVLQAFHHNLFVVGDPDQTIYTWRGADVKYLLDFDKHFPGTKTLYLLENYRSSPQILAASNSLIAHNRQRLEKSLYTQNASQILPQLFLGKSQAEEAAWIAQGIKKLTEKGFRYKDITILYRAHYISRSIEEALRKEQIPYTIYSGVSFFERKEIKDALSYLRMIAFQDDLSFLRIVNEPKRNIGLRRIADLQQKAAEKNISLYTALGQSLEEELYKNTKAKAFVNLIEKFKKEYAEKSISSLLGEILDQSGYEKMLRTQGAQDRLDNLAELKQAVHEYEISCGEEAHLADYLNHVALYSGSDLDMSKESVKMMTIHTAKGLEFEIVFLAGMSEGMFPARKVQSLQAMEEERRLAYVAMTRAKQRLYISNGAGKNFDGSFRYPSRFVLDIDEDKVHYLRPLSDELKQTASSYIENHAQMLEEEQKPAPYKAGDVVMHPAFGKGVVMDVDLKKRIALIAFESLSTERKISFRAKMEIIGQNELKGNLN